MIVNYGAIIEGLLFVVGDEGLTLDNLEKIIEQPKSVIKEELMKLKKNYESSDRGIRITYLGDAFKLTTKKEHKSYYQKLITNEDSNTLSDAALETLAIIAYNEPITRLEIDELRGVSSSQMLRKLVAKGLVKISGKSTMPGRPNLYKTTHEFLDYFGLATIKDLPEFIKEEETNSEEKELFNSIYKEEN